MNQPRSLDGAAIAWLNDKVHAQIKDQDVMFNSATLKHSADKLVRSINPKTRKHSSDEEKVRIKRVGVRGK